MKRVLLVLVLLLAACGGESSEPAATTEEATIPQTDELFIIDYDGAVDVQLTPGDHQINVLTNVPSLDPNAPGDAVYDLQLYNDQSVGVNFQFPVSFGRGTYDLALTRVDAPDSVLFVFNGIPDAQGFISYDLFPQSETFEGELTLTEVDERISGQFRVNIEMATAADGSGERLPLTVSGSFNIPPLQ